MSGVVPVKIVAVGTAPGSASQTGGLMDTKFGKTRLRIIDTAAKQAQVNGGLVPMTQATYDALIAAGSVAA